AARHAARPGTDIASHNAPLGVARTQPAAVVSRRCQPSNSFSWRERLVWENQKEGWVMKSNRCSNVRKEQALACAAVSLVSLALTGSAAAQTAAADAQAACPQPTITQIVSFNPAQGQLPESMTADEHGNLFVSTV